MGTQTRIMLAAAFLAAVPAACHGQGFSVSPVRLHMKAHERALALRLGNEGAGDLKLKAELHRWSQGDQGQDILQPSDDLVVSPPLLRVPAKGEQVVRLILAAPRDSQRQMTYRLLLREERDPALDSAGTVPISVVLSLPIFVTPTAARHALDCGVHLTERGESIAECRNRGQAHVMLTRLELLSDEAVVGRYEGSRYLLSGTQLRIPLVTELGAVSVSKLKLRAQLDTGEARVWPIPEIHFPRAE